MITGKTPDISEYLDFDFYDLVWYWRQPHPSLSEHDRELARWMGIAHRVGSDMCYWLMPVSPSCKLIGPARYGRQTA